MAAIPADRVRLHRMTSLALLSLIASRICHDLASPVGAAANGAELLVDESDAAMREQAVDLIGQSAAQATIRINYFRLAFGAAGGDEPQALARLRTVADDYFAGGRVKIDWLGTEATLPRGEARLLLGLVLVAAQSLPRGGTVGISAAPGNIRVAASGAGARPQPGVEAAVRGQTPDDALDAQTAVAGFAAHAARLAGGVVLLAENAGTVTLAFTRN